MFEESVSSMVIETKVQRVRFQIYDNKYTKENKVIDMAALSPYSSVSRLHILKSNMVASS